MKLHPFVPTSSQQKLSCVQVSCLIKARLYMYTTHVREQPSSCCFAGYQRKNTQGWKSCWLLHLSLFCIAANCPWERKKQSESLVWEPTEFSTEDSVLCNKPNMQPFTKIYKPLQNLVTDDYRSAIPQPYRTDTSSCVDNEMFSSLHSCRELANFSLQLFRFITNLKMKNKGLKWFLKHHISQLQTAE